jgi:uncharacterized protein YkwD
MNLKTVRNFALGTLILAGSIVVISVNSRTSANTVVANSKSPKTVLRVAQSTNINTAALESSILSQINQYRASKGLPALSRNSSIDGQSRNHSQSMANGSTPFSHQGLAQRIQATGIPWRGYAENVAYNQGHSDPATVAVRGWLNSPGHLRNIQGNYNQTGIGVAVNGKGEIYFTQMFMSSR